MAVYLAYSGMQDMFLTENPDFTHFKTLFSREIPYSTKVIEQAFDKTVYAPGDTLISTLRQNGDYISSISLKVKLPSLTPISTTYIYDIPPDGVFYAYSSTNVLLFTLNMIGLTAKSTTSSWFVVNTGTLTLTTNNNKFVFTSTENISYVIFSNTKLANFFGFIYNKINLFSGFVRFNNVSSNTSQVTLQESGWLQGDTVYNTDYSYLDDTIYKLLNSISLYIGNQLIQEFDSTYIKFYKDTTNTYKNRPILKLLEGNDNIVDTDRYYYFEIPFIKIPVHSIPRHSIKIYFKTNPFDYINFYASLVISFDYFSENIKLPREYTIIVPQVSFFENTEKLHIKNPMSKIIFINDGKLIVNGELFTDSDLSNVSCFENLLNLPTQLNAVVFNNPINMSRINNQEFKNSNLYTETINVLKCSNDISGLLFDFKDSNRYPILTGSFVNPASISDTYLFNQIQTSVPNILNFCSLRRVNPGYTGPVVRLRVDTIEDDFYTDTTQSYFKNSSGVSVDTWSGGSTIYVVILYDQFIYKNHIYQDDVYYQPTLVKENNTYVMNISNIDAQFISPQQYVKLTNPLYLQQFVIQFKPELRSFSSLFSNKSEYKFFYEYNNFDVGGGSSLWQNFPGAGTVYWLNNNSEGNSLNMLNSTFSSDDWTTFSSYATNIPSYDSSIGGPITSIFKREVFFTSDQTFSGKVFEIGFFSGSTMSTDGSVYYTNRKNI